MPLMTHLGLIESGSCGKEKPRLAVRYSPGLSPIYPQNRPPEDISAQSCYFFESCRKRLTPPFATYTPGLETSTSQTSFFILKCRPSSLSLASTPPPVPE